MNECIVRAYTSLEQSYSFYLYESPISLVMFLTHPWIFWLRLTHSTRWVALATYCTISITPIILYYFFKSYWIILAFILWVGPWVFLYYRLPFWSFTTGGWKQNLPIGWIPQNDKELHYFKLNFLAPDGFEEDVGLFAVRELGCGWGWPEPTTERIRLYTLKVNY